MSARQADGILTVTGVVVILALMALPGCGAAPGGLMDQRCGRACARVLPALVGAQEAGVDVDGQARCLCWHTEVQAIVVPREEW